MTKYLLPFAMPLVILFSCSVDELDGDDASAELRLYSDIDESDSEGEAAPVCDPDKTLERVSCRLDLTGAHSSSGCVATLASVEPDGTIVVTASDDGNCMCEWTPPGKVGEEAAGCGDLDGNYDAPSAGAGACAPVSLTGERIARQGIGYGATYEEAELQALAVCGAAAMDRCTNACARWKQQGWHTRPDRSIDCCVPRGDECAEGCEDDAASEDDYPVPAPD